MVSRHSPRDNQWLHTSPSIPQQRHPHHQQQLQQYQYHSRENSTNSPSTNTNNYYHHSKSHSYPDLISSSSPGQQPQQQQQSPSSFHAHNNSHSYNNRMSPQAQFSSGTYKAAEGNNMLSHPVSIFEGSPALSSRLPGHHHGNGSAQYHPSRQQHQQQMYHQQAHNGGNSMGVLAKPQQQQRPPSGSTNTAPNSGNNAKRRIPKEKAPKGDREEVWPPEVESAFMKALEVLPKLGRRKVLVNGKPCGRNELIADFIYQETGKVRDRKQVSSHIQVLKNTRKNDPEFMKLLLDSGDGDEDMAPESTNNIGYLSSSQSPNATPQLQNDPLELALFDSRSGMHQHLSHDPSSPLSAHPHGQDSYGSYAESMTTSSNAYYRQQQQHQQQFHGSSAGAFDPTASDQLYDDQTSVTTPDSAISLSSQHSVRDTAFAMLDPLSGEPLHLSNTHTPIVRQRDLFRSPPPPPMPHNYSQHQQPSYPLWPTAFRLYTQYLSAENKHYHFNHHHDYPPSSSGVQIHDLARLQDLNQHTFGTINIHHLPSEKFPHLLNLYQKFSACEFLLFKINMNLDLELEGGTFENSCLFDSNDPHRTVRCSTLIYSFGAKVLESTEIKQAGGGSVMLGGGGQKGGMGFQFVNQFFTAFLSGIRTLGTLDEVQVALSNLSIVQIYEEVDPVAVAAGATVGATGETGGNGAVATGGDGGENAESPLLVMAFEFQQGAGSVVPYFVTEGSDMLDSLMC